MGLNKEACVEMEFTHWLASDVVVGLAIYGPIAMDDVELFTEFLEVAKFAFRKAALTNESRTTQGRVSKMTERTSIFQESYTDEEINEARRALQKWRATELAEITGEEVEGGGYPFVIGAVPVILWAHENGRSGAMVEPEVPSS